MAMNVSQIMAYSTHRTLLRDCQSQLMHKSHAIKVKIAPKRHLGRYARMEMGTMKVMAVQMTMTTPTSRDSTRERMVKIVCEKMSIDVMRTEGEKE